MAQQEQIKIVGGPGKFDLMLSVFGRDRESRKVVFEIKDQGTGQKISAQFVIAKIERNDGSGENWLIEGFRVTTYGSWSTPIHDALVPFRGEFSTQDRKGHLVESPPR